MGRRERQRGHDRRAQLRVRKGRIAATTAADTITVQSTVRSSFGPRFARIALAGLVTAGLGLSTTPVTASADAPFGFIGVSAEEVFWDTDAYQEQMLSQMQANGITELRQIWRWSNIEQVRGQPDFALYDRITLAAARHNIRMLPIVGGEVRGRRRGHPATSAAACFRRATTPTSPITCGRLWRATGPTARSGRRTPS
jgi:hypothetical protein